MRDTSPAQFLLSLFTAPSRAESIAGDLTEEREVRGSAWFWFHVCRTTFALFTNAFATAPVTALALAALGLALFVTLAFAGMAAVFLLPSMSPGLSWILLSLFWWSAAWWTGVSLVSIAPKNGMTACLALALAGEAVLLAHPLFFAWSSLVYPAAAFAAAPLLAGGVIASWRPGTRIVFDRLRLALIASFFLVFLLGVLLAFPGAASAWQSAEWRRCPLGRIASKPSRVIKALALVKPIVVDQIAGRGSC